MKTSDILTKRMMMVTLSICAILLSAGLFLLALAAVPKSYAQTSSGGTAPVIEGYTIVGAVSQAGTIYVVGVKANGYFTDTKTFKVQ